MTGKQTLTTFSALKLAVMILFMVAMAAAVLAFREVPYEGRLSAGFASLYLNFLLVVIALYTPVLITKFVWALQQRPTVFIEDGVLRSFPWGIGRLPLADIASVHDERTNFWTGNVILILKDGTGRQFATREYAIRADELANDIAARASMSKQTAQAD